MPTCSHGCEHGSGAARRHFLRQLGVAGAVAGMQSLFPGLNLAQATDRERERLANSAAVRQGKAQHLTILQTSDIHGHLLTHPEFFLEDGEMVFRQAGGYARLATVFKQVRAENPGRVLAVDCGDCFQGSGIAALTRGAALVPLVNQLGYDLVLPGNWEVVYGIPRLREIAGQYRCPVVCSNMFRDETGEPLFHPYVVKEVGGVRIGGELLDERRTYTVAACARPGDPEDTLCRLRGVVNPSGAGLTAHEALKVYLARHRPVAPEIEGRVSATDLPPMVFSQLPGTHYEFR